MSKYVASREQCRQHQIFPGVTLSALPGQEMMLAYVEFEPGAVVEWHSHPHEQMGFLMEGELEFFIDEEHYLVQPGQMWRIPGGTRHRVVAGAKPAKALDVFCPMREDYL